MSLEDEITKRAREIKTDGYPMSIGEVLSMYRDGDLEVHPEFQRIYRWEDTQKWRLIESILLGIPIPTIFVSQQDDGTWDVIDGVQRLSTILEFVGMYVDADGTPLPQLQLGPTEYLPQLEGYVWEGAGLAQTEFSDTLRRDFKRSKLDFRIIKKESDSDAKFDLFQRLNSGTQLSAQESRNCLLVMLNAEFYRWMTALAAHPSFADTVQLSTQKEDEGFRQELVLRFILQLEYNDGAKDLPKELGEYVTDWVRSAALSSPTKLADWAAKFETTFDYLLKHVGEDVFRKWDSDKGGRFIGAFSISAYEAITSGVAWNIDAWTAAPSANPARAVQDLWSDDYFRKNSGSGISPRRRTPRLIDFGRRYFRP